MPTSHRRNALPRVPSEVIVLQASSPARADAARRMLFGRKPFDLVWPEQYHGGRRGDAEEHFRSCADRI